MLPLAGGSWMFLLLDLLGRAVQVDGKFKFWFCEHYERIWEDFIYVGY